MASFIEAIPCVIQLLGVAREAGVDLPAVVSTYERSIIRAKDCVTGLTPAKAPCLDIICNETGEAAVERFEIFLSDIDLMLQEDQLPPNELVIA